MRYRKWFAITMFSLIFILSTAVIAPTSTYAAYNPYQIEINKTTNKLYLFKDGVVYKVYPVATGKYLDLTPEGTFPIVIKVINPSWKGVPGGIPQNPLGPRWNGLDVHGDGGRFYGIHGTNAPESIGTHASHGCIRMYDSDVIELYSIVPLGTLVWIHQGVSDNIWHGEGPHYIQDQVQVTGLNVEAHTSPTDDAPVLQSVQVGTILPLVNTTGEWDQVRLSDGTNAFIPHLYMTNLSNPDLTPFIPYTTLPGWQQLDVDMLRNRPSVYAAVIAKLRNGPMPINTNNE